MPATPDRPAPAIQGLHHIAWRCSDSGRTRAFYEDFLGLPLVGALPIGTTKTGRTVQALHTFFQMADGSCLAFFEVPAQPFAFKTQHDYDLHIALRVTPEHQARVHAQAQAEGREVRGVADHGFIRSIYLRDPDGYVVELTAPVPGAPLQAPGSTPHAVLAAWLAGRGDQPAVSSAASPGSAESA
jgi:catechol 2,3-dioxygenase-like lactoylglutathione lyase family enzyme